MGGPFSINLVREILLISAIWGLVSVRAAPILPTAFFAVAYGLMLYSLVSHGQESLKLGLKHQSRLNEISLGTFHVIYSFILCWALHLFFYFYLTLFSKAGFILSYSIVYFN